MQNTCHVKVLANNGRTAENGPHALGHFLANHEVATKIRGFDSGGNVSGIQFRSI